MTLLTSKTRRNCQHDIPRPEVTIPCQKDPVAPSSLGSDDDEQKQADYESPPRTIHGPVWSLVVIAILSSTFLFSLDNTIVAVVQPAVVQRFNSLSELTWLSVAFLLGGGKLYGLFDGKILYIIGVILFEAGSAICGAAPTMTALIVGRAICGVGGSGMYIGVMSLLAACTTSRERPFYVGLTGLTWGGGTVLGPIIGGAFTDSSASWRWSFYINLCIGGVFSPIYLFLLPSKKPCPNTPNRTLLASLDWIGAVLSTGAFASFVMAISFGGNLYAWNSGQVIALFIVSGVLFITFACQQAFSLFTSNRLFPVRFVVNRDLVILFAEIASGTTCIFLPVYFLPLFFQFIRHDSAISAGVRMLPYIVMLIVFSIANGVVMSKSGLYWPWYTVGSALCVAGSALLFTIHQDTSYSRIAGYSVLVGVGTGMYTQASYAIAQAKVPPSELAQATGFITCGQMSGATISLTIANTLFTNGAISDIVRAVPNVSPDVARAAVAGVNPSFFVSLSPDLRTHVYAIMTSAINQSYILVMTAAALAFVLSLAMKKEKLFLEAAATGG